MFEEPEWGTEGLIPRRPYWQIAVNSALVLVFFVALILAIFELPEDSSSYEEWRSDVGLDI